MIPRSVPGPLREHQTNRFGKEWLCWARHRSCFPPKAEWIEGMVQPNAEEVLGKGSCHFSYPLPTLTDYYIVC